MNDIFFFLKAAYLGNYPDDSIMYAYNKNLEAVICNLRQAIWPDMQWYYTKHNSHEKALGVTIDNKLSFDEHITNICKTANKEHNALSWINHYMKQNQEEIFKRIYLKDKCCSWKIFTDLFMKVSLPLIIKRSTPNNISPTILLWS